MFNTSAAKRCYEAYTTHLRHCSQCHRDVRGATGTALVDSYLR